jgi:hypothetical protein
VIIIEEAHNIVGRNTDATPSPDVVDPKAFAAEAISRALLEFRGLGVSMVIVDQFPSKVAPEVIKATTSKLAFRQVDEEDRNVLGASMLFGNTEHQEIARLSTGEAFSITEGYHGPRKIQTANLHDRFNLTHNVLREGIVPYIQNDVWFKDAALERAICDLTELRERMDRFDDQRLAIVGELTGLLARHPKLLAKLDGDERSRALWELTKRTGRLRRLLFVSYKSFLRDSYRRYLSPETGLLAFDQAVKDMRQDLIERFESIIKPDIEKTLAMMHDFIGRLREEDNQW